jgi:hypothetical protein
MASPTTTNSSSKTSEQITDLASGHPPICGEQATLPPALVLTALRYANRPDIEPLDIRDVRCTLQAHPTGDHYAFVVETTARTSAWTRWTHSASPQIVLVLPDCPVTDSDRDKSCTGYELHHGGHTWQVDDPWNPVEQRQ